MADNQPLINELGPALDNAEETHAFLSKDVANNFQKKTWTDDEEPPFDDGDEDDSSPEPKIPRKAKKIAVAMCGLVCFCGFIAVIVAGSWLAASESTANATSAELAGYALLTVAGVVLLMMFCVCCASCMACCNQGGGGGDFFGGNSGPFKDEFDPNDVHQRRTRPMYIFKVWGDDLRMDLNQHEALLTGTLKKLPKPVLDELNKAVKAKKDRAKKERLELEKLLKIKISESLTLNQDPLQVVRDLRKRVYVIDFNAGQTHVDELAAQVTLVCKVGNASQDVVVFRISSPGGYVSEYGLAASQLIRLKEAGYRTLACVDSIAASGGYMLCSVCDEICAAPFAYIGSIGVITYIPNFDRLAKETLKVDMYQFTAGKHKRTVDIFGEVTEEGKQKLKEEISVIHSEFKNHIKKQRGDKLKKDIDDLATGEAWLAVNALELGLVDRLITSDQVLLDFSKQYDVLVVCKFQQPKAHGLKDMFGVQGALSALADRFLGQSAERVAANVVAGGITDFREQHRLEMV